MSRYTTGDLIKDATRKLSGAAPAQSSDFFGAIDEGRRLMLSEIKPVELVRTAYIEQALYDQVDKYAVPDDLSYDNLIEIKMLHGYRNIDTFGHPLKIVYNRRFDQKRRSAKNVCAITWENGIKYMRIFNPTGLQKRTQLQISDANSLSDNGTWNVGGNLVNLSLDNLKYINGTGALRFDFNTSTTTGFLENTTLNAVDMRDYLQVGAVFAWLNVESPRDLLSVMITIESSPGNNYQYSVNQSHDNSSFIRGWNLLKFGLDPNNGLVINGTPDPKAITAVRFDFTTSGLQPIIGCHIDNIVLRKGVVYQVMYDSSFCFIDALTGAWKQFTDNQGDVIPLEEDAFQVLSELTSHTLLSDMGKADKADTMLASATKHAKEYRIRHKNESIPRQSSTYIHGNMYDGYMDDPMSILNDSGTSNTENASPENYDDSFMYGTN